MTTANDILQIARNELGVKEQPTGSNKQKYGKWYGLDGQPWCMIFVQWVFAQAGAANLLPTKTASCGALMNAAKAAGCWITSGYSAGDVVIFDWPQTPAKTDHCGIIEEVYTDYVSTIEGNTGVSNDSNGGEVMRRTRAKSQIIGAVRPPYNADIDTIIDELTAKQLLRLVERIQWALSKQKVSKQLEATWREAQANGITDGSDPQALCTRAQAAAMVLRGGGKRDE